MISRHWRALALPERADEYVTHLRNETFPAIKNLPGCLGATVHRREQPAGVEFIVITHWASLAAIHAFSGADAEAAVVPPKVRDMMIEFDVRARHYHVLT